MTIKLVVLPHAGGASHAYQKLQQALAPSLNIYCHDFPGHGRRSSEPLVTSMDALASDLLRQVELCSGEHWAIFGHSMGALLGHAVIHKRQSLGLSLPVAFFASGAASPVGLPRQKISLLPGELFWAKICTYGLIPNEILKDQSFRDYFEILLRNDFSVVESYLPGSDPFKVPLHVLYGQEDMSAHQAESWREVSLGDVQSYPFSGGHFFLFDQIDGVCQIIQAVLNGAMDRYCYAT